MCSKLIPCSSVSIVNFEQELPAGVVIKLFHADLYCYSYWPTFSKSSKYALIQNDFQYGFRSSRSTEGILIVVSDRIARAFNRSEATRAVALDPRLLTGFGMLVFFTNFSLIGFQVRCLALFLLFSVIVGFEWFWMGSLDKNIQLMPPARLHSCLQQGFFKAPFLVLHFSF